jgi:hypothetical protein
LSSKCARSRLEETQRGEVDVTDTATQGSVQTDAVETGLFIGGEVRRTAETLDIPDPAKPGVVVGRGGGWG